MAHEIHNQNFFSVRQPAWHRIGKVLDNPPTIQEAIEFSGLNYEVEMVPLVTMDTQTRVDRYATRRKDNGLVLGTVGARYEIIQNSKSFDLFQPLLDTGSISIETGGCLREGARVFLLASIPGITGDVAGDAVKSYFLFANGHDGTMALHVGFTPVRVVCANTLASAQANTKSRLLRIRHTAGSGEALDILRDTIDVQNQQFHVSMEQYAFLASRLFKRDLLPEFVVKVMGSKEDSKRTDNIIVQISQLLDSRTNQTNASRGTWWGAYNAVNELLQHDYGRSDSARLDSMWFGQNANRNQESLALAVGFADAAPASGVKTTPATIVDMGKFRK